MEKIGDKKNCRNETRCFYYKNCIVWQDFVRIGYANFQDEKSRRRSIRLRDALVKQTKYADQGVN